MNEMPKDPILGTDNTLSDNTQKLAETIQELNSVIADVNNDTFSDTEIPAFSAAPEKTASARPVVSQPGLTAAPAPQYSYNSGIPQAAVPDSAPQYTRPVMQQPYPSYPNTYPQQPTPQGMPNMKFCKFCAARIPSDAVICTACGRQVEQLAQQTQQPVIINNTNTNVNNNNNNNAVSGPKPRNKWTAFILCLLLGYLGVHKFYEGRILSGLLYLFTGGLFGIGWLLDTLILLFKPNPYYIK